MGRQASPLGALEPCVRLRCRAVPRPVATRSPPRAVEYTHRCGVYAVQSSLSLLSLDSSLSVESDDAARAVASLDFLHPLAFPFHSQLSPDFLHCFLLSSLHFILALHDFFFLLHLQSSRSLHTFFSANWQRLQVLWL